MRISAPIAIHKKTERRTYRRPTHPMEFMGQGRIIKALDRARHGLPLPHLTKFSLSRNLL
jgi:hypothetical protein